VGNVLLKCAEGCAQFAMQSIKREVRKSLLTLIGAVLMKPALRRFRRRVDYDEYGGAPLLGTNGVCIICHGKSNTKAFKNALSVAREAVTHQLNQHILDELNRHSYLAASFDKSVPDAASCASSPDETARPEAFPSRDSIPNSSSEVSVQ
jgi:fatty acid/phospholipid biosynthesis enzyme